MSAASRAKINRLRSSVIILSGGASLFSAYSLYSGDGRLYQKAVMPIMRFVDAETAHDLAIQFINYLPKWTIRNSDNETLKSSLWNKTFPNPVGIAAGFDKNGKAINGMFQIGCGFAEIGSVTPKPQHGNEKPRVFRLPDDAAVINRYGFNNDGHDVVRKRVVDWREKNASKILGVNLGKNKHQVDAVKDYVDGVERFGPLADYLVINISSPNTPGLRSLQSQKPLARLLENVLVARSKLQSQHKPLIFLKVAPDLSTDEMKEVAQVVMRENSRVDGLIISNTTLDRPSSLKSHHKAEAGGLSGAPLREKSTEKIREMYTLTQGKIPIIGCGGISNGRDAYDKIKAGASLIQLYTALVYLGPPVIKDVQTELAECIRSDGFRSLSEAVGIDTR